MKILIVCPFFPPELNIAAQRIFSFAEHFASKGNEVTVLSRRGGTGGMDFDIPKSILVHRVSDPLERPLRASTNKLRSSAANTLKAKLLANLRLLVLRFFWPDPQVFWGLLGVLALLRMKSKPDVVIASGPPWTAVVVAKVASLRWKVPFVVDFRDVHHYSGAGRFARKPVNEMVREKLERRLITGSLFLTAVSDGDRRYLQNTFNVKAITIENGFEPSHFSGLEHLPEQGPIRLRFFGTFYERYDVRPVFRAIKQMNNRDSSKPAVLVEFFGLSHPSLKLQILECGVESWVRICGQLAYRDALSAQINADILLALFREPDIEALGMVHLPGPSGKIYSYLGSKRPILAIGPSGADGGFMEEAGATPLLWDQELVLRFLEEAVAEKEKCGMVVSGIATVSDRFYRKTQSEKLLGFLRKELKAAD